MLWKDINRWISRDANYYHGHLYSWTCKWDNKYYRSKQDSARKWNQFTYSRHWQWTLFFNRWTRGRGTSSDCHMHSSYYWKYLYVDYSHSEQRSKNCHKFFSADSSSGGLMVSIINMPVTILTIFRGQWIFSETACTALGFINMLTLVTSVLSLCNISINRYIMVCKPTKFKDVYTKRNAIIMIAGQGLFL